MGMVMRAQKDKIKMDVVLNLRVKNSFIFRKRFFAMAAPSP